MRLIFRSYQSNESNIIMNTRISRLGKNTLLVLVGNLGGKMISFLMLPFYTHWLSVEDYGLTDILTVYVSFLIGVVTCCIGESLFIFPKDQSKEKQTRYYTTGLCFLFIAIVITGIGFFCIKYYTINKGINNSFTDNVWLIYFMLISQIVQQVSQQFTRSIDKMVVYSITGVVYTISTAFFAFILIPQYGIGGYIWSIILANILAGGYTFLFSKSYLFVNLRFVCVGELKKMLSYSVPLIPNGIMWWLVNALNRPIMERHLGLHDVGVFAVANKIPAILGIVFTFFAASWQISVLEEFGKKDYCFFFNRIFRCVFFSLLFILVTISLSSKCIVGLFASQDYYEAWRYVPILTIGTFFASISSFLGANFNATRESKYLLYSSLQGAIISIGLNSVLIPRWGLYGASLSIVFSFFAIAMSRFYYGRNYVKLDNKGSYMIYVLIAVGLITLYVRGLNTIIIFTVSTIMVVGILYRVCINVAKTKSIIKK